MKELGAFLRQTREEKQVTLEELAEKTKIRKAYLEAIEGGDQDVLPDEVYVRGFLRIYAKVLGIDPDEVIRMYDQGEQELQIQQANNQRQSLLEKRRARRRRKRIRFAILGGLIIIAFGIYYYYFR
ncbi:MAG: helix-turn-helix domain-containing protein [Firmicutes bacterium]|jgi:cytoskeletal protein RodZ|nr:helix-turn-helix domain-containing protein [Bacillota bacterium]